LQPSEAMKQELRRLSEKGGGTLTPSRVVDVARSPLNPLHKYFEWDDAVAAEKYRQDQARELIRCVHIEVTTENVTYVVPCYVRDTSLLDSESGYIELLSIRGNPQKKKLIVDEMRMAMAHLKRAGNIALAIENSRLHVTLLQEVSRIEAYLDSLK